MIPQCKKDRIIVSATEPTTNEKVWIQKGKNWFNKNNVIGNLSINADGVCEKDDTASIHYVQVVSGKTYTISSNLNRQWVINTSVNKPSLNGSGVERTITTGTTVQVTIPEGHNYLNIRNHPSSANEDSINQNMQVEEGTEATEHEAHINRKIYVDGEEFINQTEIEKTLENLKGKVLWTNENYTSGFEAQTVNVDLSNYNFIRVIYTHWGGSWSFLDGGKVPKGVLSILNHEATTSRRYTSNNEGVIFENPSDNGNALCQVPIYIIGYKYW